MSEIGYNLDELNLLKMVECTIDAKKWGNGLRYAAIVKMIDN